MQYRRLLIFFVLCTSMVRAQDGSETVAIPALRADLAPHNKASFPAANLRSDVNRVLIPVTVTDLKNRLVEGLGKEDFRVSQDGVPLPISEFFVDESPVSIGIVLDASNSMHPKIDNVRRAIREILKMAMPEDEFFLITVQDKPDVAHAFTRNVEEIDHEVASVQPRGWTALYDGIYLALNYLRHGRHSNRVVLVMSDGEDNNSRYTESEINRMTQESDARVFTISILDHSPTVEKLARVSGGRAFRVHKLDELSGTALALSALIHGEYVVGFNPPARTRDGKYHAVKVELALPPERGKMQASWRHGYFAPAQ